mgnify:CR=1 FL=1
MSTMREAIATRRRAALGVAGGGIGSLVATVATSSASEPGCAKRRVNLHSG